MTASEPSQERSQPGRLHVLIDELASAYAKGDFAEEIAAAREDFFNQSGKVFEGDAEVYELRSVAFLEWYVLERPLPGGLPPVLRTLKNALEVVSPDRLRLDALARLASSHRSLFDIADVEGNTLELEDVLGGGRFRVVERRSTVGFEVGSVVEARLAWDGSETVFTKTFLFHPKDARGAILDQVDQSLALGMGRNQTMFHLAQLYLRWHRQGHVNAVRIYKGLGSGALPVSN